MNRGELYLPGSSALLAVGIASDTVVVQFSMLAGGASDPSPRGRYSTHRDTEVIAAFISQLLWDAFDYEHK